MEKLKRGFSVSLENNLTLRIAENISEIKKIATFNTKIHNEPLDDFILSLFTDDPFNDHGYWLYIEDPKSGEIRSSLALLWNRWSFGSVDLKIAEMGFVGTLEEHRGKGLYGILNIYYEKIMKQNDLHISVLRGIPYFYSKFGYGFSLPTNTGYCVKVNNFDLSGINTEFSIRRATKSDNEAIGKMYIEIFAPMYISATFDQESFHYRFNTNKIKDNFGATYIVQNKGKVVGFFTLASIRNSSDPDIFLISNMEISAINEVVNFIVRKFNITDKICFNVSDSMVVYQQISDFDLEPLKGWKWQIKITNLKGFINSILPILQQRLSESSFSKMTKKISISNYKEIVELSVDNGELSVFDSKKEYPDRSISIRIPYNFLPMFILGEKSYEEIKNFVPDIMIGEEFQELSKVLFPLTPSYPIYRY